MPKYLLDRCLPDSIAEFRTAATERFAEANALDANGHRTGAIYLWGYCAEMTLKAAYFALNGFHDTREIAWADLDDAIKTGRNLGIVWPRNGAGHNLRAWANLLIAVRSRSPGLAYRDETFGAALLTAGARLEPLWQVTLRYHKNVAYHHEVRRAREATDWLMTNSLLL